MLKMPSNSLPDANLNLPEMKTKSPSCPAGGVHMYAHPMEYTLGSVVMEWKQTLQGFYTWKMNAFCWLTEVI